MSTENFSAVLGKLSENGGNSELDGPAFRVSTKVAEVMLSLGVAIARSAVRASAYYEETIVSPPIPAPLSLSELKEQVARATSVAELGSLRRRFARCSHPDRHNDTEDSTATCEMAAANRMIDEAITLMRCPR